MEVLPRALLQIAAVLLTAASTACRAPHAPASPRPVPETQRFTMRADRSWRLNLPGGERFDASGLLLTPDGELLTVNDRGADLYRIQFSGPADAADLVRWPEAFPRSQLAAFDRDKHGRYDCEGIAQDEEGRIYLCEEADRWILRWRSGLPWVERLAIDWTPVRQWFHPTDANASFEGVAVGGGRLFVANERQQGRILVVSLDTLQVMDDFAPRPTRSAAADIHYTDLCWFEGSLFVLLRGERAVLRVDPATHAVLAEYSFAAMERGLEAAYLPTFLTGFMEGLAVDRQHFWLVTDNNGSRRLRHPTDLRPTLFRCPRPDRAGLPEEENLLVR